MDALAKTKKDLGNLLRYTEELLSFNDKVVFDLTREKYPRFPEHVVVGLEGVDIAVDAETWVRARRLRETPPPPCDAMFDGWVDVASHPSPNTPPKLVAERMLTLPIEEISDLAEAGLLPDLEDVMVPVKADTALPERMDVILRTANMVDFRRLWQDYIDGPWTAWAQVERPRRQAIDFYNKIYAIHLSLLSMGDDTPIELVFGAGMARWATKTERVSAPLIEQLVETELEEDGTLLIRPRRTLPHLALRPFHALEIEGCKAIERDIGAQFDALVDDPDRGFTPFDTSSFESVLRVCAARLSATGIYHPDTLGDPGDRTLPAVDGFLRITDTWVLYVRPRGEDIRKDDISRLIKKLDAVTDESDLPRPARGFVEAPSDTLPFAGEDSLIDLSGADFDLPDRALSRSLAPGAGEAFQGVRPAEEIHFFPLPYNDDQQEIIRRLQDDDTVGVLVQGPPGTGKTHTIANIICHYLATKRRVLVTAKTPEALTALQEKIPEGIRDLAIAVIHNDREGARQLENAVRILADEAKSINPRIVNEEIREKQARIASLRETIATVDRQLLAFANHNLAPMAYGDDTALPMEVAKAVVEESPRHLWFEDRLTTQARHQPRFSEADIAEIRALRHRHAGDLAYPHEALPKPADLPELARVLAAHRGLARINEIEAYANAGEIPALSLDNAIGLDGAQTLAEWLQDLGETLNDLESEGWLFDVYHGLLGLRRMDERALASLKVVLSNWIALCERGRGFALKGVILEGGAEDPAFDKALEDLAAGRNPFGVFSLFKGGLKSRIEAVRLEGHPPATREDWATIQAYRVWRQQLGLFLGRWNAIAQALDLPPLPAEGRGAESAVLRLGGLVERVWRLHEEVEPCRDALRLLFPYDLDIDEALYHGRTARLAEALAVNLEKADLADAETVKAEGLAIAQDLPLPFHAALRAICHSLGLTDIPQTAIAEAWRSILSEAVRLEAIADDIARLDALVGKVSASGAPLWAAKLRTEPPRGGDDPWTPDDWRKSWDWARAKGHLRSLGDRETVRALSEDRARAEAEQRKLFAELVRLRTFLGLKLGMSNKVEAALAKFGAAIARLGKGTGKSAGRQRRIIREAAMETAQAVPCWILPEWRVAEQLPPDLAAFDLVIIDEASQSDITALPAILRGKKVLIVGDDKQVSPTIIGLNDRKIIQLRTTFLSGLPFADQMDPATSLYELGGMVFPGKAVMLREHFRCVEPIIRFSSGFYPTPLIPLRLPKASERLDPPLIDIYVPHGRKTGEINRAESDVIVDEITKLTQDPAFQRRSIGVISLIGSAQARLIYERLVRDLGTEVIEKHRILCGSSATFQGQERDIMFLSMVACPETAIMQAERKWEQRFNVATSRARDRLVLVRSVAASHLKPGDLKARLIEHFRNPMAAGKVIEPTEVLDLCDSGFERDFGRCLLDLGYRLKPQVPVGGYRIDFVVEGADDRRLAIELDGDKYHGPDRWAHDLRRQKALERLGWIFWRCWGSSWISDRQGCLDDLKATMTRLGIEPLGMAGAGDVHTLHIEVARPAIASEPPPADLVEAPPTPTEAPLPTPGIGLDLGDGAVLAEGEEIFCFLHKKDAGTRPANGVAVARGGALHMNDAPLTPQRRGAWLQAALVVVQKAANDLNPTTGEPRVLNAWAHWFVRREATLVAIADIRKGVKSRAKRAKAGEEAAEPMLEGIDG
ncbi:DNA helicase [Rhodospirillum rubrum F11]|uniref:DNA helicase, putative n=2 Tax=Rhodospirillum rubrum TaxID=1085 RepID=Q2RRC4_RHORT|nr:AAA domain-containing protein [Rhodospirillum rubrum]ABC23321.1 DNA helicase, putative [Rhodospirillum rubrum ATCC 11170]AEO49054.1 DNA helicase [Rhodospirillum rubrum F11]MBK5954964.1 very short patch repair endonuclease [Rhodospirillum rubrum]QXG79294.1 AAA family ATPase [Rhodospirillum rubrum]HAQ01285.1 very short patch repair endonuclease [Rhodospirillum rubrum]